MAGFWEKAKYWLDPLSSHGVGVGSVSAVCPRAGGLSRRRRDRIIVAVAVAVVVVISVLWWLWVVVLSLMSRVRVCGSRNGFGKRPRGVSGLLGALAGLAGGGSAADDRRGGQMTYADVSRGLQRFHTLP